MKQLIFSILITLFLMGCKKDELYGIYSNEASGFSTITLVVHESGHGCIVGPIGGGTFGEWSYDGRSSVLTLSYFSPGQNKEQSYKFRFDQKKRTYTFTGNQARADPSSTLHFITNAIPDQLIKSFKAYPESLVINKQYAQEKENLRRQTEDKLEREKPEYERIKKSLEKNLKLALSDEFYVLKDTPATRALRSVLADNKIIFPEDSLVGLLTNSPPVKHWIIEMIFNRPELSAKTIESFYPKALEWGTKLNYSILANIANHPNTPICLIEDLATRTNFPCGATGPANTRLINYSNAILDENTETPPEAIVHLFEFTLNVSQSKNACNEMTVPIFHALAKSSKTPTNMLAQIATTDDQQVQIALVNNVHTPMSIIKMLSASRFSKVRATIAKKRDTPLDILLALSQDKEGCVREEIANHPNTPVLILTQMQADHYFDVRRNLIRNPNTPYSVLKTLASDKYTIIASEASGALRERDLQKK